MSGINRIAALAFVILLCAGDQVSGQEAAATTTRRLTLPRARIARMTRDTAPAAVQVFSRRGVDRVNVQSGGLQLEQGEVAVLHTSGDGRDVAGPIGTGSTGGGSFRALNLRLVTLNQTGTDVWVLRPVYKVATRLRWLPDSSLFRGRILLAVEDSASRSLSRPLTTPVRFQLTGDADFQPSLVELKNTNFPLTEIDVVARRAADSIRVHIMPEFDVRGADVWVPVEPSITVEALPPRIQGWGVGSARVIVRMIGATGAAQPAISLSATAGELDSVAIAIGNAATAITRIRSGGTGPATLTASAPGFNNAQATIEFVWPYVFFLAALLGGVFGGLAAAAQNRRGRRKARWADFAVKGVFAGLLAALLWYALGVNLLQIDTGVPRFNELAVFAFAALAGYIGIPRIGARAEPAES